MEEESINACFKDSTSIVVLQQCQNSVNVVFEIFCSFKRFNAVVCLLDNIVNSLTAQ